MINGARDTTMPAFTTMRGSATGDASGSFGTIWPTEDKSIGVCAVAVDAWRVLEMLFRHERHICCLFAGLTGLVSTPSAGYQREHTKRVE